MIGAPGESPATVARPVWAYCLIALSIAVLLTRPYWIPVIRQASSSTAPSAQPVEKVKSPALQIVSQYALGAHVMLAGQKSVPDEKLAERVTQTADNAIDEFRAIPVIAELSGRQAALDELDRFEQRHKVVRLRADVDALRLIYTQGLEKLSPEAVRDLALRHHWFGEVAGSFGLPDSDPRRVAVLVPARRTVIVSGVLTVAGLGGLVAGIVLFILAITLRVKGQLPAAYRPESAEKTGPFVEAFAIYLALFIALSAGLGLIFGKAGWTMWALTIVLPVAVAWLRYRGVGWAQVCDGLGLRVGRGFFREAGAGIIGYIAGLPVLGLGMLVTIFLVNASGAHPTHPIQEMPTETAADKLQIFLMAAVWAPIIEELMFRGALFHHLRSRHRWWFSTLLVSLIFAVIHPQGWTVVPALSAIAIVLAGIREWRGSIIGPMVAHGMHNGALVVYLLTVMS